MPDDLTEKIQASQNKFERLISRIPGYAGYKQKELRREADRMLRLHVAQQYEMQLKRLNGVQQTLVSGGRLKEMNSLERAATKMQTLIDRIKTASYGYAGLFDAVKVQEDELDRLYDFDEAMLTGVDTISSIVTRLEDLAATGDEVAVEANQLTRELETLNNTFSHRQDVLTA